MTPTDDNPWDDFAAELGITEPAAPAVEPDDADDEAESVDDTAVIPEMQAEPIAGDGENGTGAEAEAGRRRKRRRRRKKKGGAPVDGQPEGEAGDDADASGTGFEDDAEEAPVEPAPSNNGLGAWNVPSWDDIVAGLYRPDR